MKKYSNMPVSQEEMQYCASVTGRNAVLRQCHRKKCCVVPVSQEEMLCYASVTGGNVLRYCSRKKCGTAPVSHKKKVSTLYLYCASVT